METLRTDELDNAIDYLEKAASYFNNRDKNNYWFKWLMISLHGALYGFAVCAVKGIKIERVLELKIKKNRIEKKKKEMIEYYRTIGFDIETIDERILNSTLEYNLSKLLSIKDVIELCQNEEIMMQRYNSKALTLTENQDDAINKVISYRNEFAHFKPRGLSVITFTEKWIVKEVVEVIKFLALESGNIIYTEGNTKEQVESILQKFDT